jgi:UPF0176 protein
VSVAVSSTSTAGSVTNISAYRFAHLQELKPLRDRLRTLCDEWRLRGTILLSTEGINLFVAGGATEIEQLLALLRAVPGLEDLQPKVSISSEQPFTRMLVKIKKEIIAFGVSSIDPIHRPAPRLSAVELKQWLDEGRPVTLLDTRNDFEVDLGTFRGAHAIGIAHFREFPEAVRNLPRPTTPIVTFCTGGIRCEKAAPYMIEHGFDQVYQLDGGILKYFEECGRDHFDGDCFVFDKRVGLAADLNESGHGLCYVCQSLLTAEELADPLTIEGVSCPRCFRSPEQQQATELSSHREKLRAIATPLPGRRPEDNFRPLRIHARHGGFTILDFLCDVFPHVSRSDWEATCDAGDIVDGSQQSVSVTQVVQPGERYYTRERMEVEPDVNAEVDILDEDAALIVVNKPAPLPMHPSGRYRRNTLQWLLCQAYAPQKPRPAHRLDANTSGLAVFTRTQTFAKAVQGQFERGEVEKRYLARVYGHPSQTHFTSTAPISKVTGPMGTRRVDEVDGLPSHTDFEVLARDADGTALVLAMPRTGRTNQIRIHLWHLGYPIVGDAMYRSGQQLGEQQTLTIDDSPLMLHAWQLALTHPQHDRRVSWETPRPAWASAEFRTRNSE